MKNRKVESTAEGKTLAEGKTMIGIFQWDALSPFVVAMMILNHILRESTGAKNLQNHLKRLITSCTIIER